MNELWRKRVKNDALSLLLTGKSWPEAADILRKRYERVRSASTSQQRRCVREPHERLCARLRSPLQLFLGAQLRGIPHPDEPEL